MTNLQQRNEATSLKIDQLQDTLAQLQEQLKLVTGEVRVLNQQHKAQENLSKEWKKVCANVTSMFKDACSVYGEPEALDDMLSDLVDCVEGVKEDFEEYQQSDRYVNQDTAEEQDVWDQNNLLEATAEQLNVLPSAIDIPEEDDDDIILSQEQLNKILGGLAMPQILQLRDMLSITKRAKRIDTIAGFIAPMNMTHKKLSMFIANSAVLVGLNR